MNRTHIALMLASGLAATSLPVAASPHSDYARVIASDPVYEYVGAPQRECWNEQVGYENSSDRSFAGAVVGGIAGGILGHQVGKGSGKSIATAVGAATGAIVGDSIDNDGHARGAGRPVYAERCRTVDRPARQIMGYNVTYRYQGHDYTTFMRRMPGDRIRVRVNVEPDEYNY